MSELSERLRKAKALIDAPEKWTKGYFARDAKGRAVFWGNPHATCFCAEGAVLVAGSSPDADGILTGGRNGSEEAFCKLYGAAGFTDLAAANDQPDTTHADVMRWFDAAIAKEEAANG